jgi:hypothetical protein
MHPPRIANVVAAKEPPGDSSLWNQWSHNLQIATKAIEVDLKLKLSAAEDALKDPNSKSVSRTKASTLVSYDGRISTLKTKINKAEQQTKCATTNNIFAVTAGVI